MGTSEVPATRAPAGRPAAATEWVTVAEAAGQLAVNARTLRRAAATGALDSRRSGKVWLTTLAAARAWLKDARHRPGPRLGRGIGRPKRAGAPAASADPAA